MLDVDHDGTFRQSDIADMLRHGPSCFRTIAHRSLLWRAVPQRDMLWFFGTLPFPASGDNDSVIQQVGTATTRYWRQRSCSRRARCALAGQAEDKTNHNNPLAGFQTVIDVLPSSPGYALYPSGRFGSN